MKIATMAVAWFISIMLVFPAYAEIYRYIDANGQTRWTDDLSQIPKEQRATAQRFEEAQSTPLKDSSSEPTGMNHEKVKVFVRLAQWQNTCR